MGNAMNIKLTKWRMPDLKSHPGEFGAWNDRVNKLIVHCLNHDNDIESQKLFRFLHGAYPYVATMYEKAVIEKEEQRQLSITHSKKWSTNTYNFVLDSKSLTRNNSLPEIMADNRYYYYLYSREILGDQSDESEHMRSKSGRKINPTHITDGGYTFPKLDGKYIRCRVDINGPQKERDVFNCFLLKGDDGLPVATIKDVIEFYNDKVSPSYHAKINNLGSVKNVHMNGSRWFKDIGDYKFTDITTVTSQGYRWSSVFKDRININFIMDEAKIDN